MISDKKTKKYKCYDKKLQNMAKIYVIMQTAIKYFFI